MLLTTMICRFNIRSQAQWASFILMTNMIRLIKFFSNLFFSLKKKYRAVTSSRKEMTPAGRYHINWAGLIMGFEYFRRISGPLVICLPVCPFHIGTSLSIKRSVGKVHICPSGRQFPNVSWTEMSTKTTTTSSSSGSGYIPFDGTGF